MKIQLLVGHILLGFVATSSATEWTGLMSCGALQNATNPKTQAPFKGRVTLTIEGSKASLDRNWPTGKEHSEGTAMRGQSLQLEGQGWVFNKEANAWKIRATLVEMGDKYDGTATIESQDRNTKYRDCTVSVRRGDLALNQDAVAGKERLAAGDSQKLNSSGSTSIDRAQSNKLDVLIPPSTAERLPTVQPSTSPVGKIPREVDVNGTSRPGQDPSRQADPPNSEAGFWEAIKNAAGNRNERDASTNVKRLLDGMRMNVINNFSNPNALRCTSLEGTDILFRTAEVLTDIRLPNTERNRAREQFQSGYNSFQRICPAEVERGNKFLGELSRILSDARSERMKQEDSDRDAKDAQKRRETDLVAQKAREVAQAKVAQEMELANQREEERKARTQRIADIKAGKVQIASISDAAAKLDAGNAAMIIFQPPVTGNQNVYHGFGQVVVADGRNALLGKLGDRYFALAYGSSTLFLHDAKSQLRVGGLVYFVGRYIGVANTEGGPVANFVASHIDTRN